MKKMISFIVILSMFAVAGFVYAYRGQSGMGMGMGMEAGSPSIKKWSLNSGNIVTLNSSSIATLN